MRRNYWDCTKFADWLRGTPKLEAGSGREWREWTKQAKGSHPIRYWIVEEGLSKLQDIVMWPIDRLYDFKYRFLNQFVTKTHMLKSNLKRGEWHEFDERIMHCLFDELVDFIEIEKAWKNIAFDSAAREKYSNPWYSMGWLRTRSWRCPAAGLDYLDWESQLVHDKGWGIDEDSPLFGSLTDQAIAAQEQSALYHWWKYERPLRKDPHDLSGWTEICERRRNSGGDLLDWLDNESETEEEKVESQRSLDLLRKIEQDQEDEDEAMLIRLIKIRHRLWT